MNDMRTIDGSVWYRERIALPPDATIRVYLEDVARMDVASEVIATTYIEPTGGPPWIFTLAYDAAHMHDRGRYVLRARIEAGGRLLFINTESIPAFEGDPDQPRQILVSRVGGGAGDDRGANAGAGLIGTSWRLVELEGAAAEPGAGGRELQMILDGDGRRVSGFSGCNRFTGGFELDHGRIRITGLASTKRACVGGMEQEQRFLDALHRTIRYTIAGDELALYSGDERLILRFRPAPPE